MAEDLLRDDPKVREAFRQGKRWALNEVYRVYFPVVSTVVSRGSGNFRGFFNPADRDDAIQTIFAAAFEEKARLSYNGLDAYKSFIRGVAQNVCRRMLEKKARFDRRDWDPDLGKNPNKTAEDALLSAESSNVMRKFVDQLEDPLEKEILNRYFVNGEAEETIAKNVNQTRYRVRKIIGDVHSKMKRWVKSHGLV